eukprot:CAMPEP_0171560398 /NCGR_PEP_ID=MMETSP0960-20121227/13564_1 /TAXON_ID=87120 /ORGANISM="Aurantiochytrium limacinum, Strain ATCCMYA-1381" /LENGTH=50 /DNA_ID=CAMNT_0012112373 /DNA_START=697 /DNA_END=846 /DNA_ORIENTATION=-
MTKFLEPFFKVLCIDNFVLAVLKNLCKEKRKGAAAYLSVALWQGPCDNIH